MYVITYKSRQELYDWRCKYQSSDKDISMISTNILKVAIYYINIRLLLVLHKVLPVQHEVTGLLPTQPKFHVSSLCYTARIRR